MIVYFMQQEGKSPKGSTKDVLNVYDKEDGPMVFMDNPSPRPLSRAGSRTSVSRPGSGRRASSSGSETELVAKKMLVS